MNFAARPACQLRAERDNANLMEFARELVSVMAISSRKTFPVSCEMRPARYRGRRAAGLLENFFLH